jgi:hypothetical protein
MRGNYSNLYQINYHDTKVWSHRVRIISNTTKTILTQLTYYSFARAGKVPYTGRLALSSISINGRPT